MRHCCLGSRLLRASKSALQLTLSILLIKYSLHKRMREHLNAEIALETLTSIDGAIEWLKSTYLFVRMKKNPVHYNLPRTLTEELLEKKLEGKII